MTTLVHVPQALLPQVLQATRNWLVRILETRPGWITEQQAVALLMADELQLHLAIDENNTALAAMVTELRQSPAGMKVCNIVGIAGVNRHLWMDHLDGMEQWARAEGCGEICIKKGRKGWLREDRLKPYRVSFEFERTLP
jgi:hypothetical protein